MSMHGLTVRLPYLSITISTNRSGNQHRQVHSDTSRRMTRELPARREVLQAREMLSWQSLRQ